MYDRLYLPSQEKSKPLQDRSQTFEIFKIQETRKRFESVDNFSIIITNDFRQFMDDFQIDQASQADPIDLELKANRRKCSIIDQGENLIVFPALEKKRSRNKDFQNEIDEINLEIPPETDFQIEFTFFDENFGNEEPRKPAKTQKEIDNKSSD